MRVDLPAPFSPSRAWISPGLIVRLIRSLATTFGYRFVMLRISSAGASTCASPDVIYRPLGDGRETERADRCRPARSITRSGADHFGPTPQPVSGQVLSVPAFIAARAASSLLLRSLVSSAVLSWKSDTPIPLFAALNLLSPATGVPPAMPLIASPTAIWRCFSALVTMHLSAFGYDRN